MPRPPAGGLVNPAGPPRYYVADYASSLDSVFDAIASRVVSCTIALSSTPPDPDLLFVNATGSTTGSMTPSTKTA